MNAPRVEYQVFITYDSNGSIIQSWLNDRAAKGFRLHSILPCPQMCDQYVVTVVRQVQ